MLYTDLNKSRLQNLLIIDDLENENIYSIIGRMESILDIFKGDKALNHLIPFLQTYLFVTKNVSAKSFELEKFYKNYPKMEKLDIYFASLYFKPLYKYLTANKLSLPWKTYFEFCSTGYDSPFIQILTGINVHINSDLCQTLVDIDYKNEEDYMNVNQLLIETIPDLMKYLAFSEKDIIGFGGIFMNDFYKYEFNNIIVKWRNNAWKNAERVRKNEISIKDLQVKTDLLSLEITNILKEIYKPSNALTVLKKLNLLEVVI